MKAPGVRFHPVTHNRKLAPVEMEALGAHEEAPKYAGHTFNKRPVARGPFCSATYVSIQATCPNTCPFKRDADGNPGGCYVDAGFTRIISKAMDEEAAGLGGFEVVLEEAIIINHVFPRGVPQDGARGGRDLRLHIAGDVPTDGAASVLAKAARNWKLRGGGTVWTYTHNWRTIARAAWGPIVVLASVENAEQASEARARGYAPAIVVDEFPNDRRAFDLGGTRFIPCPAETSERTCVDCRLCLDRPLFEMGAGIAFKAHGWNAAPALAALRAAGKRVA